jgi:hypothetical protein
MRTVEVTDDLQAYLDGLVPKRDKVLARLEEEAHREGIPIVESWGPRPATAGSGCCAAPTAER